MVFSVISASFCIAAIATDFFLASERINTALESSRMFLAFLRTSRILASISDYSLALSAASVINLSLCSASAGLSFWTRIPNS